PSLPEDSDKQNAFFALDLSTVKKKHRDFLETQASLLRRFLVHRSPVMPVGVLRFCLEYASKDEQAPPGVLSAVREGFRDLAETDLVTLLGDVYDFRNRYVAHSKDELDDLAKAESALHRWIDAIRRLSAENLAHLATSTAP